LIRLSAKAIPDKLFLKSSQIVLSIAIYRRDVVEGAITHSHVSRCLFCPFTGYSDQPNPLVVPIPIRDRKEINVPVLQIDNLMEHYMLDLH
jgi:hypothetical protein